ncbi:MAG: transcriptional repressor LexA [Rhizobiales bacterium]|nr:transcriptional repressor LexA [Hyphomicrobiales bacterium]
MLTKKQKDLLLFIHSRVQETGVSPSFDEMKDALELKSKSGIHRLITALEERGFIRRLAHRARALEILKLPEGMQSSANEVASAQAKSNVVSLADAALKSSSEASSDPSSMTVPVMGRIAAGVPISAIQDHNNDLVVSPDMLGNGNHYALEVHGDSMIDEGILDGDTVLIKETSTARNGDIVVAFIIEEEEATLKKIYKSGNEIELVAANPAYEPRKFTSDKVQVQGQLIGLVRKYH